MRAPKFFVHDAGQEGAKRDFPRTIDSTIDIEATVGRALVGDERAQTLHALSVLFPNGRANCWGVPSGAKKVLQHLTAGDYVLLCASTVPDGTVHALCWVKYLLPVESTLLSTILWGESRFPLIFFFDTEPIAFIWEQLRLDLGYLSGYTLRGTFAFISDEKLRKYGGAQGYARFVRRHYGVGALPLQQARSAEMEPIRQGELFPRSDVEVQLRTDGQESDRLFPRAFLPDDNSTLAVPSWGQEFDLRGPGAIVSRLYEQSA